MNKETLHQNIFIAFMVGVFFEIFEFTSWFFEKMLGFLLPFGDAIGRLFFIVILLTIFSGLLWDRPHLLYIKDKEIIHTLKLIFYWSFTITLLLIIYIWIYAGLLQGHLI